MKTLFGILLISVAGLIEAWLVLVLLLKVLAAAGLIDQRGSPNFFSFLFIAMVLQVPILALIKSGLSILASNGRIRLGLVGQMNLIFVGLIISVVAFLKTVIPYLQHKGSGFGITALASAAVFAILCFLIFRVWNKVIKS